MATAAARSRGGAEHRGGPRLVVVLDEPHQPFLVGGVGEQVQSYLLGVLVHQPVVEALVVAEVEALLLELPLQVPVGLGDEPEGRVGLRELPG